MSNLTTEDVTYQTIFQFFGYSLEIRDSIFVRAFLPGSHKEYYVFIDSATELPKCYSLVDQTCTSKLNLIIQLSEQFPTKETIDSFVQDISYLKNVVAENQLKHIKVDQVLSTILKITPAILSDKYTNHPLSDKLFSSEHYPEHLLLLNKKDNVNFLVFSDVHHNYASFPCVISNVVLNKDLPGSIQIYFSPKTFIEHVANNGIKNYLLLGNSYYKDNENIVQILANTENVIIVNDQSIQELQSLLDYLIFVINDRDLDKIHPMPCEKANLLIYSQKAETAVSRAIKISALIKIDPNNLNVNLNDTFEHDIYSNTRYVTNKTQSVGQITSIEVPYRAYLYKTLIQNLIKHYSLSDFVNLKFYTIERDIDTRLPASLLDGFI